MHALLIIADVTGSGGGIINGAIVVEAVPLPAEYGYLIVLQRSSQTNA
jgi:hypothetical protein